MTTTHLTRLLAAAALLALALASPARASAEEVPMTVGQPVPEGKAGDPARPSKAPAEAKPTLSASRAPVGVPGEIPADTYLDGGTGPAKARK